MQDTTTTKSELKLIPTIEIDPFDPEAIRLSPADQQVAGEKLLVSVPVRKPNKAEFFRVSADPAFTCDTALLEVEGEFFLVIPRLRGVLQADIKPVQIYTCYARTGGVFLWPVRLPGADGRDNRWWQAAHQIARTAQVAWVRAVANMSAGNYEVTRATVEIADPIWPEKTLRDLLHLAFKDNLVDSLDHLVVRRLQGRV
jgi:hypothetical protein